MFIHFIAASRGRERPANPLFATQLQTNTYTKTTNIPIKRKTLNTTLGSHNTCSAGIDRLATWYD